MAHIKSRRVYACSNVEIDYFKLLISSLEASGAEVIRVYLLTEEQYRSGLKHRGIRRIYMRLKMYIGYPFRVAIAAALAPAGSIFVVTSNTFYATLLVAVFARWRGGRIVHLLYDLFPDALEVAGKITPDSAISRLVGCVTKLNQRLSHASVYLGDVLRLHAEARWGAPAISRRIDISADSRLFQAAPIALGAGSRVVIHYGGQLGYMHDAEALASGVKMVIQQRLDVSFTFRISGARAGWFQQSVKELDVEVLGTVPSHEWRQFVRSCHVGLVSLSPGGATVCLPSKTYAMMGAGLAIIAVCPVWSDLAKLVVDSGAGWVVNNSVFDTWESVQAADYENRFKARSSEQIASDFTAVVTEIVNSPNEMERRRRCGWDAAVANYGFDATVARWSELLNALPGSET